MGPADYLFMSCEIFVLVTNLLKHIDDKFEQDDFDAEVNSDPRNDELGVSTSTGDLSIDCSDENSSNVNPATAE